MRRIFQLTAVFIFLTSCLTGFMAERCNAANSNYVLNSQSNIYLWNFKTNGIIYSTPLIDNGVVYIGSTDSCFYAINAATGAEVWHYKSQNQIFSTAVKKDSMLCFESGNAVYGLNLNGGLSWKYIMYDSAFQNMHDEWDYYHSSPRLVGNIVYIGSEKGLVFGIDIRDGSKVFKCQTPTADYTIETTPAVYDNKIYFGDWNGVFYAYDLTTGNLVWQHNTKIDRPHSAFVNAILTDPVIFNGAVYFGGRNCNMYCLDAMTGVTRWIYQDPTDQWLIGGPTIVDSVLYIGSSYQHVVRALDALTGSVKWDKNVEYRANGKPMIDGEFVYIGTQHDSDNKIGTLCALNKSDGNIKVKINLGTQIYSTPVLSNGAIVFGGSNGYVYAINQQEFNNIPYPDTYITLPDIIDFGSSQNKGKVDTSFYVYNKGNAPDSVSIALSFTSAKYVIPYTIQPSAFILAAHDSQSVLLTLKLDSLRAQQYFGKLLVNPLYAVVQNIYSRTFKILIEQSTKVEEQSAKPYVYYLGQNYPNPFNPSTTIEYQLSSFSHVELKIFDVLGREVISLIDANQNAGTYRTHFDGSKLCSGMYFYRITASDLSLHSGSIFTKTNTMLLLK